MADNENGSNQPEMTPEDKKLHDMLQRELIHYSMTFKESIDNLVLNHREETQKLIEQNLNGVVDAILAKNEQNAQLVVDKTIAALRAEAEKQQQAAPRPQPGTTVQPAAEGEVAQQGEPQMPAGPIKPLDYLMYSIGKFLQQTTPKDIIETIKTLKGGPAVNTLGADMVIQGFKTAKLFNNIDMAKTDIETFSKLAHETLDTRAPSVV